MKSKKFATNEYFFYKNGKWVIIGIGLGLTLSGFTYNDIIVILSFPLFLVCAYFYYLLEKNAETKVKEFLKTEIKGLINEQRANL